jgi:drug/metabolite transporter (DMT)-like permease
MKIMKPIKYATYLVITTSFISGTNNFLTKIAVTAIKDPIIYTALKNAIVAVFLVGIVLAAKKLPEIMSLTRKQSLKLLAIGIVGGSVPFALFFTGLTKTSALNAGLIHKTLFLWVAIMAMPLLKERISMPQWLGIAMIFAANLIVGGFTGFKFNHGELMILAATIFWAVENIIAKSALKDISSSVVAASRMAIGSAILFGIVFSLGDASAIFSLDAAGWGWTLLTSALLFGYVITWYTALKYAPATYIAILLVPATLVTNILSALFITHSFTINQLISAVLFIIGTALIIRFARQFADNASKNNRLEISAV